MAETLTPITNTASQSVDTLVALVNAIVSVLGSDILTANSTLGITIGNAALSGIFSPTILATPTLRGGNVTSSANLVITSNTYINSGSFSIGNSSVNAQMNSVNLTIKIGSFTNVTAQVFNQSNITFSNTVLTDVEFQTSGAVSQIFDSFLLSTFRTAEYTIQVVDNQANAIQTSKLLVSHNGTNAVSTDYALLYSNTNFMTFSVWTNSTALIVNAIPTSTNTQIRALRTTLTP